MGSKKQLSQARRLWEKRISRPLEVAQFNDIYRKKIFSHPKYRAFSAAYASARMLKSWVENHETIYSIDSDFFEQLQQNGLPSEPVPSDVFRRLPHTSPVFVLEEPIILRHTDKWFSFGHFVVNYVKTHSPESFKEPVVNLSDLGEETPDVVISLDYSPESAECLYVSWIGVEAEVWDTYYRKNHGTIGAHLETVIISHTFDLKNEWIDLQEQLTQIADNGELFSGILKQRWDRFPEEDRQYWINNTATLFPIVAMSILYACTEDPDLSNVEAPDILRSRGSYKGASLNVYDLGIRIGNALRVHRSHMSGDSNPSGRTVIPHLRRAHWHRFWTGPRNGERKMVIRWLPPIPVNLDKGDIIPTVHKV